MNTKNIENIFELSPLQQGMTVSPLYAGKIPRSLRHQYAARLKGDFNRRLSGAHGKRLSIVTRVYAPRFTGRNPTSHCRSLTRRSRSRLKNYDWRGLPAELQQQQLEDFCAPTANVGSSLVLRR